MSMITITATIATAARTDMITDALGAQLATSRSTLNPKKNPPRLVANGGLRALNLQASADNRL